MTKKTWKIVTGLVVGVIVVLAGYFVARIVLDPAVEDEPEMEEAATDESLGEAYGYAEPETVLAAVARFNQKLIEQEDEMLPAVDETVMVEHEGNYWYPLYEDVALVVVPVEFTGSGEADTVLTALIYTDKDSVNRELAMRYFNYLVLANNDALSADDAARLVAEAEGLQERGEMANQGDGIFVAVNVGDDHVEYQVVRNYRGE